MFNPPSAVRSRLLLALGAAALIPNSVVEACNTATQNTLTMELCPNTGALGCLTSVPPGAMKDAKIVATFTVNGAVTSSTLAWPEYTKTVCSDKSSSSSFTATDGGWDLNNLQTLSFGEHVYTKSYPPRDIHIWANYSPPASGSTISIDGTPFNSTGTNIQAPMGRMQDYLGAYASNASGDGRYFAADMNNDGLTDIVKIWNDGGSTSIDVLTNNGDGTFTRNHWVVRTGGYSWANRFAVGDFDGDGWMDLVCAWADGGNSLHFSMYMNNQGVNFRPGVPEWQTGSSYKGWGAKYFAGDFNGDGIWDILQVAGEGGDNISGQASVDVFLSTGTAFSAPTRWVSNIGNYYNEQQWIAAPFSGANRGGVALCGLARITGDAATTQVSVWASNGASLSPDPLSASNAIPYAGTYVPLPYPNAARTSLVQVSQSGSFTTYYGYRNQFSSFAQSSWQQNYGAWAGDGTVLSGTWWPGQKGLIRIVPGP